jgi:hypothetical protein
LQSFASKRGVWPSTEDLISRFVNSNGFFKVHERDESYWLDQQQAV